MVCGDGMAPLRPGAVLICIMSSLIALSGVLVPRPLMAEPLIVGIDVGAGIFQLDLLAQNIGEAAPNAQAVERHRDGIGAAGRQATAPSIKAETGFDPRSGRSEILVIQFKEAITRAYLDLSYFYAGEAESAGRNYHERGVWQAYHGARQVDRGSFVSNSNDGHFSLPVMPRAPFDRLLLSATPYISDDGVEIAPGLILTDSSDFLLRRVAYVPVMSE